VIIILFNIEVDPYNRLMSYNKPQGLVLYYFILILTFDKDIWTLKVDKVK
jgi:hypothetical protein